MSTGRLGIVLHYGIFMGTQLPINRQLLDYVFALSLMIKQLIVLFVLFISSIYLFYKPLILYYKIEKLKILFVELNNKWRGQDIVKLITCPLIKLQFYLG